ncbi:copper chaperone PCu(A)C [Massilia sp. MS-15]|uniref:copper chaperone PCu(A)C n=1 Tax=Massilia sp. MS-15 TaxID=2878200 RepID=UPI001CD2B5ED|nr:copper chaperone PCu(A)C [Massilia sp. MS-15]MCA1246357.1 copper chaperone PCu(A)C [Massilia sp. MS-15]
MKTPLLALIAGGLLAVSSLVHAQVSVTEPWIRATVPAQKVTGAFMRLQSATPARLVGVQSAVAGRAELHEMAMDGQTMRMRRVEAIVLPAGKPVDLASGGYHIMLMDLQRQVKEGERVDLTLQVEDAAGKRQDVKLSVPVRPISYSAGAGHQGH